MGRRADSYRKTPKRNWNQGQTIDLKPGRGQEVEVLSRGQEKGGNQTRHRARQTAPRVIWNQEVVMVAHFLLSGFHKDVAAVKIFFVMKRLFLKT